MPQHPRVVTSQTPVGHIFDYAGGAVPNGYLLCDGSSILKADYFDLWSTIGTTYGGGGLSFNLPDCRGRVAIGVDTPVSAVFANRVTKDVNGSTTNWARSIGNPSPPNGGEETHAITTAEMHTHTHGYSNSVGISVSGTTATANVSGTDAYRDNAGGSGQNTFNYISQGIVSNRYSDHTHGFSASGSGSFSGNTDGGTPGNLAHNNVQPSLVITKMIKY